MGAYLSLAVFVLVATAIALVTMGLAILLRKKGRPEEEKYQNYECGEVPQGTPWIRFHAGYYLVALIFILFDVEALFLFPWALTLKNLGILAFVEMTVFVVVLLLGWLYAYKKGAIEWV